MNRFALFPGLLAATAAIALSAGAASAQSKAPFMQDLPFTYEGQIGGLDAWSLEGHDDLWLVLPDGNTVIAGFVFNGRGRDIGSVMLGLEPIDVQESLGLDLDGEAQPEEAPQAQAPVSGAGSQVAAQNPEALQDALRRAAPSMAGYSDAERDALLADLVEAMSAARTPDEFQGALVAWHARVTGQEAPAPAAEPEPEAGLSPAQDVNAIARQLQDALQGATEAAEVQGDDGGSAELLADFAENSFWFPIGNPEAEPIYMVFDPACPYCSRSIRNLEPRIRGGEIQLRIVLVPAVSDASLGLVSAILAAEDAAEALVQNGLHMASFGRPSLDPVNPGQLDPALLAGVQANLDLMAHHQIPGVPFFAWQTAQGPRFLAGVAARDYRFAAAPGADG